MLLLSFCDVRNAGYPWVAEHPLFKRKNFTVFVPISKRGEALTAEDAVASRKVTRHRGVVERVNHCIKINRLLREKSPTQGIENGTVWLAWRVAATLHNRFFVPLAADSPSPSANFKRKRPTARAAE
jgi:hypothetical protein